MFLREDTITIYILTRAWKCALNRVVRPKLNSGICEEMLASNTKLLTNCFILFIHNNH
jgi:hypothetical protein